MKHTKVIVMAALIGLVCIGSAFAHGHGGGRGYGGWGAVYSTAAETVTVSGTLQLINGEIAVAQGGNTYYPSGLSRYVGFIDGLKEGASVKLEGNTALLKYTTNVYFLRVTKLTLNGKEYSL
ncbi:hypothetical protein FACS1894110_08570 [Spirochaetia bacterium]|nr:hypothetical protein FACS1894110_08570 [Spirochaetia bacterium]